MRKWALVGMAAVGLGCPGEQGGGDGHDVIQLRMATNEAESPFAGTASVVASLEYDNCLLDFYAGDGAQLTAEGVDGARVFDDWSTRLCEHDIDAPASCDVLAIDQRIDYAFMRVDYDVDELDENQRLAFGPIPTNELTDCTPSMSVTADHQVTGFTETGETLWTTDSWHPERSASGDGAAIAIYAATAE